MLETIFCTMPARPRGNRWEKFGGGDWGGVTHCEITFIYPAEANESNCDGCSAHVFSADALTTAGDAAVLYACCFESYKPSLYASLDPSVYFSFSLLLLAPHHLHLQWAAITMSLSWKGNGRRSAEEWRVGLCCEKWLVKKEKEKGKGGIHLKGLIRQNHF